MMGEDGMTQEDFTGMQAERFAQLDTDGDGIVTQEEFAAHAKTRGGRQAR